jgi:protein-disulfide isomerase
MCAAAQGKFWQLHDRIFATQTEWTPLNNAMPVFEREARTVSLDMTAYSQCMNDNVMLPMIESDLTRGQQVGVSATPSFLIGNRLLAGAQPIGVMRPVIDSVLAEAARPPQ